VWFLLFARQFLTRLLTSVPWQGVLMKLGKPLSFGMIKWANLAE
jgi:hypothetical protein